MKNNNSTFIVLGGILVLSVFSFIVANNILTDSDNRISGRTTLEKE